MGSVAIKRSWWESASSADSRANARPESTGFVRATLLAAIILLVAACILALGWFMTLDRSGSPWLLLNGGFVGEWELDEARTPSPDSVSSERRMLAFEVTEDVALARWNAPPAVISLDRGLIARGSVAIGGVERRCEFKEHTALEVACADGSSLKLWIDTLSMLGPYLRFPSTDRLLVEFQDGTRAHYLRAR